MNTQRENFLNTLNACNLSLKEYKALMEAASDWAQSALQYKPQEDCCPETYVEYPDSGELNRAFLLQKDKPISISWSSAL